MFTTEYWEAAISGLRDSEVNGGGGRVARSESGSEVRKENGGWEEEQQQLRD